MLRLSICVLSISLTPKVSPLQFHDFSIDVCEKAYHGLRAYAIIRSLASGLQIMGAVHVGLEFGYGFINRIEDCNFYGSSIAVKSADERPTRHRLHSSS